MPIHTYMYNYIANHSPVTYVVDGKEIINGEFLASTNVMESVLFSSGGTGGKPTTLHDDTPSNGTG